MKQLTTLVCAALISTCTFATGSGLSAGSPQLKALSSAWKTQQSSANLQLSKDDITMGYGGADMSRRPTIDPRSTTA
jgi:hypothetical protein